MIQPISQAAQNKSQTRNNPRRQLTANISSSFALNERRGMPKGAITAVPIIL
jgi:hypothetical protein